MKSFLSTFALCILTWANPSLLLSSTNYSVADTQLMRIAEKVESDLLQGVWTAKNPSVKSKKVKFLFQFKDSGKLDFLELQPMGNYAHKDLNWVVEVQESGPHLLIFDTKTGKNQNFELVQTNDGMELTEERTGEYFNLDFHPRAAVKEVSSIKKSIVGEWLNSLYPFEIARNGDKPMPGAFLQYQFNSDGTYSKLLGNNEAQLDEVGTWEISKDGQYLLLHTNDFENGRKVKKTCMAKIKFVMMDEMVLEHSLQVSNESFCTHLKDFYFSKI